MGKTIEILSYLDMQKNLKKKHKSSGNLLVYV